MATTARVLVQDDRALTVTLRLALAADVVVPFRADGCDLFGNSIATYEDKVRALLRRGSRVASQQWGTLDADASSLPPLLTRLALIPRSDAAVRDGAWAQRAPALHAWYVVQCR